MPARNAMENHRKTVTTELGDEVRVGKYVRRSTDDDHQPYSIDAQDTRLDAYITSQPGWHLAALFTDAYGYQADKATATLIPDPGEAAVIALIFDLYVTSRLGGKNIAATLNQRGHRTTAGGLSSGHQIIRVLANRVYLGDLTFRGTTITGTHQPLIPAETFAQAAALLTARRVAPPTVPPLDRTTCSPAGCAAPTVARP